MIIAGLKLTILGMAVVICFLLLLVLIMNISFKLLGARSAKEQAELIAAELKRQKRTAPAEENLLVAVISAAVAAHRRRAA